MKCAIHLHLVEPNLSYNIPIKNNQITAPLHVYVQRTVEAFSLTFANKKILGNYAPRNYNIHRVINPPRTIKIPYQPYGTGPALQARLRPTLGMGPALTAT
jgi:hypothetical protein